MKNTKGIYRLNCDFRRQGNLKGIFIAKKEHVKILLENKIEVYWGEVLGKHSEIYGAIEEDEIELVSDSPEAIKVIEDLKLENGYNPFEQEAINFDYEGIENGGEGYTVGELIEKIIELEQEKQNS